MCTRDGVAGPRVPAGPGGRVVAYVRWATGCDRLRCDGELIIAAMDGVRRATPTRVPCIRSSGAAARVARSRGRGRAYTVRTLKPLPVTSRDYDGRLYRTQEVALSGHTAVALPSIPGLAVYLGLTWAGCSPLVFRSSGASRHPGAGGTCGYGVCKYLRPAATSIGFQAAFSSSSGPCLLLQSSSHH